MKRIIKHLKKIMQMVATMRIHAQSHETRNGLTAIEHEVIDTIRELERQSNG